VYFAVNSRGVLGLDEFGKWLFVCSIRSEKRISANGGAVTNNPFVFVSTALSRVVEFLGGEVRVEERSVGGKSRQG
jgi:hypothetical protein